FSGAATTFSGNTATRTAGGQNVGNDICASSSNSAAGNGAVIEISAMPTFGTGAGYGVAVDRSILVLAAGQALPSSVSVYRSKEFTCGYTYSGSTLTFTSLTSGSGITTWKIYWDGSAQSTPAEYTADSGAPLPSGTVDTGTAVLIKGYKGANETMTCYMIPTLSAGGSGASQALLDDALFDDAEVFEGLAPESSALDQYCDECYL
ncbi:MAG: hypothetical protein J6S75_04620, partial [Thermoguttaceae bacterium]|nr:hypothetical protein [Thermoguttaceae bacterium]